MATSNETTEGAASAATNPRRTKAAMENELNEIQQMISTGYTDNEIMHRHHLKERNYYKYKKKLYERSAQIQAKKDEQTMIFEQNILKDRLVRFLRLLEVKAGEVETRGADTAACMAVAQDIGINIMRLEFEGIRATRGLNNAIRQIQSKGLVEIGQLDGGRDDISQVRTTNINSSNSDNESTTASTDQTVF